MGLLSSLIDSFTGKSQQQAVGNARQSLTQAHAQASPYYEQASKVYDPFIQTGEQANTAYSNALGLNGADAAGNAWNSYYSNPGFRAATDQGLKNIEQKYNAGGLANSGASRIGAADYVLNGAYGNYLNRLQGQGQQGLTAAGGKGNALRAQGDFTYGYGTDLANNDIAAGNAKSIFGNNVAGLIGTGLTGLGTAGLLGWNPLARRSAGGTGSA